MKNATVYRSLDLRITEESMVLKVVLAPGVMPAAVEKLLEDVLQDRESSAQDLANADVFSVRRAQMGGVK